MDWDKFLKRYVWDEEKTPYFVPVGRLTRRQADNELRTYVIFMATVFGVVTVAALAGRGIQGYSVGTSLYAASILCAALVLGITRHPAAAVWMATAPPVMLLNFFLFGYSPKLDLLDHVFFTIVVVLWLRYTLRTVAISRAYAGLPDTPRADA